MTRRRTRVDCSPVGVHANGARVAQSVPKGCDQRQNSY